MIPKMDHKWSSTASDPQSRLKMIPKEKQKWFGLIMSILSLLQQVRLRANFTSQINTVRELKLNEKDHSNVNSGSVGNTRLLPNAKMLLVPISFFSGGYIILWRKTFCRLFHTERSWHAYFSAVIDIVSGQDDLLFVACEQALSVWGYCEKWTHEWHARGDTKTGDGGENRRACLQALPFDARAFPLTSFEMQCSSLRLNKGFRLFNFLQSASWIWIIISDGFLRCFVTW